MVANFLPEMAQIATNKSTGSFRTSPIDRFCEDQRSSYDTVTVPPTLPVLPLPNPALVAPEAGFSIPTGTLESTEIPFPNCIRLLCLFPSSSYPTADFAGDGTVSGPSRQDHTWLWSPRGKRPLEGSGLSTVHASPVVRAFPVVRVSFFAPVGVPP